MTTATQIGINRFESQVDATDTALLADLLAGALAQSIVSSGPTLNYLLEMREQFVIEARTSSMLQDAPAPVKGPIVVFQGV